MMSLTYCLNQSARGDNIAAYEAAKIMQLEKYSEMMVQAQLRKAASLGNIDAMRWLGFLGLSNKLISPESTVTKITYYHTYDQAYNWFVEASKKGDTLSAFVVSTCLQHGIGTPQDTKKSEEILSKIERHLSIGTVIAITSLINTLSAPSHISPGTNFIEKILSNQGGQHGENHQI